MHARSRLLGKMSADGTPASGRTRILTARKRNRKEVLANYNKARINIGHQHDRWMELKEALRVQTQAEVFKTSVPLRIYTGSSEFGTCIINDAGRQAAHKKQRKYTFFW